MSIESLFDHSGTVYKFAETLSATRAKINSYAADATEEGAIHLAGVGVRDGRREGLSIVYMRAGADVVRNDVWDVTSGPNAPLRLKVITVERPRGHHTECTCEPFNGSLT